MRRKERKPLAPVVQHIHIDRSAAAPSVRNPRPPPETLGSGRTLELPGPLPAAMSTPRRDAGDAAAGAAGLFAEEVEALRQMHEEVSGLARCVGDQ